MPQNAAKSWESGSVRLRGWKVNLHCRVCSWKFFCVHERVFVCGADSWTAARSPVTPLQQKSFWWPVHSSCQCCTNAEGSSAVQTHAQCHLQIAFTCVHVCSVGWLSECMWIDVPSVFVCALPNEVTLGICVHVCACFVPSRCFLFFQGAYTNWIRWTPAGAASLSKVDNIKCILCPIVHMLSHTHARMPTHAYTHRQEEVVQDLEGAHAGNLF